MPVAVLDRSLKIRILDRHQRPFRELAKIPPEPDPADRDRTDKIQPVNVKSTLFQTARYNAVARPYKPIHIDEPHKENENRERRDPSGTPLEVLLEQNVKRKRKMEQDQSNTDIVPNAFHPG